VLAHRRTPHPHRRTPPIVREEAEVDEMEELVLGRRPGTRKMLIGS
jgi:hypothetical protein